MAENPLEGIQHFLLRDFHGLPVWAWGAIGAAGLGLGWYITHHLSLGGGTGTGTTDTTPTVPTTPNPPNSPLVPNPVQPAPVAPVTPVQIITDTGGPTQTLTNPIDVTAARVAAKRNLDVLHQQELARSQAMSHILNAAGNAANTVTQRATNQPYRTVAARGRSLAS